MRNKLGVNHTSSQLHMIQKYIQTNFWINVLLTDESTFELLGQTNRGFVRCKTNTTFHIMN